MNTILAAAYFANAFLLFGTGLKTRLPFLLLVMLVSSFSTNQTDEIDALYQSAINRLSKEDALFLKYHFVKHTRTLPKHL
jgi:hypothetical protein